MGLWLSRLADVFQSFSQSQPARILMLGLDAAGKTTILYKIKLNETVSTIPTIGFNVETVSPSKGISFTVWDVGGQDKIRPLWRHYYQDTEGLVYVVDSNDRERLGEAREELMGILESDEMKTVPVVVLANKQDLPCAMSPSQVADGLGLGKMARRPWHVQGTCATSADGVYEAMDALARLVKDHRAGKR